MALIKCPECGNELSDKAPACPHCGYVMKKSKGKFKKSNIIKLAGAVIVVGAIGTIIFTHQNNVSGEQNIKIDRWELMESGEYSDTYECTLSSDNKHSLLAVIGSDVSIVEDVALLKDGSGQVEIRTNTDPSEKYKVSGYLPGKEVNDKIIKNIKSEATDYDDYDGLEETTCDVSLTIELKEKISGILFGELSLDIHDSESEFCVIPIIDGKGEYNFWESDIPYKMRGINVEFKPQYLCTAQSVSPKNYKVLKEFEIDRDETSYGIVYSGSEELEIPNVNKGILIYTAKEEGSKDNGFCAAEIENSKCELSTYKYIDTDEEKDVKPEYQIDIKGYIEIGKVKEEKGNE